MCRLLKQHRLLERAATGEFRIEIESHRKDEPFEHYNGKISTWNDELFVFDDRYAVGHHRHDVARIHQHRCEDGSLGGSGLPDPKDLMIDDTNYRGLKKKNPVCALCTSGDWIPPEERFFASTYKPSKPNDTDTE
jgi:hypothetical protein